MENAAKALEYAFAVLVFGIALTVSIYMFSKARATSDTVFAQIDTKQFYTDVQLPEGELDSDGNILYNGRFVNVETIIPTLYRDYKENYIIEFWSGEPSDDGKCIIRFDLSAENRTHQIWTAYPDKDVKRRLDYFINGNGGNNYTDKVTINYQPYDIYNDDIAFVKGKDGHYNISEADRRTIAMFGLQTYLSTSIEGKIIEEFGYVPTTPNGKITEDISRIVIRYYIPEV